MTGAQGAHAVGHFRTRRGPRWAFHKAADLEVINTHTMDNVTASKQPKVTRKSKVRANWDAFRAHLDPRNVGGPMRYALGHRSLPFHRF